jgi:hypothetical protein
MPSSRVHAMMTMSWADGRWWLACVRVPQEAIAGLRREHGVGALVTGDILDVCEAFMDKAVAGTGCDM